MEQSAPFQSFEAFVAEPRSADAWYDYALEQAERLLQRFTAEDWAALEESWREHETGWQRRSAEALSGGDPMRAVALLTEFLGAPDTGVREAAAFSLAAIPDQSLRLAIGAADPVTGLETMLANRPGPAVKDSIERFLPRWRALTAAN